MIGSIGAESRYSTGYNNLKPNRNQNKWADTLAQTVDKDAIIKEIRKGDDKISKNSVNDDAAKKKKRNRINKERADEWNCDRGAANV